MKKATIFLLVLMSGVFFTVRSNAQVRIIVTMAGDSIGGYSGDDSLATHAELMTPSGVAADRHGNIYIVDQNNNRCRKVDAAGIITTIAGDGTHGYTGDSSLATASELYYPTGVAVDAKGNIYIADQFNNAIRKIDTAGIITTFAGNGTTGFSGDSGIATTAQLWHPADVGIDGRGNVYIVDQDNSRIRKVDTFGIITTFAGTGAPGYNGDSILADTAQLNFPQGIAVDRYGNVFIADFYNSRIRKVDTTGMITTVAGNGTGGYNGDNIPAIGAEIFDASAVAIDDTGNIYISDYYNSRIRKVNVAGIITTVTGNDTAGFRGDGGPAIAGEINYPEGVAVDTNGNIYIADYSNGRVRKVMKDTTSTTTSVPIPCSPIFDIFPNPSNGKFNIVANNAQKDCSAEVYNMMGQRILQVDLYSVQNTIDLSGQPPGIYFLYLRSGAGTAFRKLVIGNN